MGVGCSTAWATTRCWRRCSPRSGSTASTPTPERPHTTVLADVHHGSFGAAPGQNHSLATYAQIAGSADGSADPSIGQAVASMHEAGFLSDPGEGTTSHSISFQTQQGAQICPVEPDNCISPGH